MYKRAFATYNITMNIREFLHESRIEIAASLYSKDEALDKLIELQKKSGTIHNPRALKREIVERERIGNSAVSCRTAIPCVSHSGALRTAVSVLTVKDGVDYQAPDKRPVKMIFLIAGKSASDEYLKVKEHLQRLLTDPSFAARLCAAKSKEEFLTLIEDKEKAISPLPFAKQKSLFQQRRSLTKPPR